MLSCADAVEAAGDVDAGPVRGGHPHRGVVRVTARREHRPSDGEGPDLPSERGRRQGYGGRNADTSRAAAARERAAHGGKAAVAIVPGRAHRLLQVTRADPRQGRRGARATRGNESHSCSQGSSVKKKKEHYPALVGGWSVLPRWAAGVPATMTIGFFFKVPSLTRYVLGGGASIFEKIALINANNTPFSCTSIAMGNPQGHFSIHRDRDGEGTHNYLHHA
eukprot:1175809-Prorocentrum_minimum.AAC.1